MTQRRLFAGVLCAALTGCAGLGEGDYDRHRLSRIGVSPEDPGAYLFETKVDPKYPADSAAAEAIRMEWLSDWMARRQFCAGGYEVAERRAFEPGEMNPYGSDLRYTVKCADTAPPGE